MLLSAGHSPYLRKDFSDASSSSPSMSSSLIVAALAGEWSPSFSFNLDERIHILYHFLPPKSAMQHSAVPLWSLHTLPLGSRSWFAVGRACELPTGGREGTWTSGLRHHLPVDWKGWRHIVWRFILLWFDNISLPCSFFTASSWWANVKNYCH